MIEHWERRAVVRVHTGNKPRIVYSYIAHPSACNSDGWRKQHLVHTWRYRRRKPPSHWFVYQPYKEVWFDDGWWYCVEQWWMPYGEYIAMRMSQDD